MIGDILAADPDSDRPLVMVSVGTDHHPFDRLVSWMDDWALSHPQFEVVIQRGTASAPLHADSMELLAHDELRRLFSKASAVVSHGGPSTVMDARMAGRLPIVVPRDPARGEHVDDHQIRFTRHLGRHGLAVPATSFDVLGSALLEHLAAPEAFEVEISATGPAGGVVRFGELLDSLLGTSTPLSEPHPTKATRLMDTVR